jgi:hypothetical protein
MELSAGSLTGVSWARELVFVQAVPCTKRHAVRWDRRSWRQHQCLQDWGKAAQAEGTPAQSTEAGSHSGQFLIWSFQVMQGGFKSSHVAGWIKVTGAAMTVAWEQYPQVDKSTSSRPDQDG